MTAEQRAKICKQMLWIIPGLILAIIGDYCMGIEPKDSMSISFMESLGWIVMFLGGIRAIRNDEGEIDR
jgi:hypothetical protein